MEGMVTKNCLKYLPNVDFTRNILRTRQKAAQMCHIAGIFLNPLTLGDRVNFVALSQPNPNNSLG
jgi:hypothetical protein